MIELQASYDLFGKVCFHILMKDKACLLTVKLVFI